MPELQPGETVYTNAKGERWAVTPEKAEQFSQLGFRPETPDEAAAHAEKKEYAGALPAAEAFGAGVARGGTLGLSDLAMVKSGLAKPQTLENLKKYQGVASGAGELTGTLGSLFIPGVDEVTGPALVAKLGHGVATAAEVGAESLAKRVLARSIGGTVEGAIYGAANALDDSVLGDSHLTAEKLLGGAGIGALTAGVSTAGFTTLGEGLSKLLSKAREALPSAEDSLQQWANIKALKATGAAPAQLGRIGGSLEKQEALGQTMRDEGILKPGQNPRDILEAVTPKVDAVGQRIGEVYDTVQKDGGKLDRSAFAMRLQAMEEGMDPLSKDANQPEIRRVMKAIYAAKDFGEVKDIATRLGKEAKWVPNDPNEMLNGFRRDLAMDVRGELNSQVASEAERIGTTPGLGDELKALNKQYSQLKPIQTLAEMGSRRMLNNQALGLTDKILLGGGGVAGALLGGGFGSLAGTIVGPMLNKLARERGASVVASLADKVATSPATMAILKSFQAGVNGLVERAPDLLGKYGAHLAHEAAKGPEELFFAHIHAMDHDAEYAATMDKAGFGMQPEERATQLSNQAHGLAAIGHAADSHMDEATKHVAALVNGEGMSGQKPTPKLSADDFAEHAQNLGALTMSPGQIQAQLAKAIAPISGYAPNVAAALIATASSGAQYLQQAIPKNPAPPSPIAAFSAPWQPSQAQLAEYNRVRAVVERPQTVLERAREGRLTPAEVTAIRATYPALAKEYASALVNELATNEKAYGLGQQGKNMVGMLLGADVTGNAPLAQLLAKTRGAPSSRPSQQPPPNKPATKGANKLTLPKRMLTSQQAASDREA